MSAQSLPKTSKSGETNMNTIDGFSAGAQRNQNLTANLENGFCNIINGEKIGTSKRLSVIYAGTDKQPATVLDLERGLLAIG